MVFSVSQCLFIIGRYTCVEIMLFGHLLDVGTWQQLWHSHDDVIKWKHFPRCWPFVHGNSPVTGEFPSQRQVKRSFDVFFDLCLNKQLSKQSWVWWFEIPLRSLWCHCYVIGRYTFVQIMLLGHLLHMGAQQHLCNSCGEHHHRIQHT